MKHHQPSGKLKYPRCANWYHHTTSNLSLQMRHEQTIAYSLTCESASAALAFCRPDHVIVRRSCRFDSTSRFNLLSKGIRIDVPHTGEVRRAVTSKACTGRERKRCSTSYRKAQEAARVKKGQHKVIDLAWKPCVTYRPWHFP